MSETQEQQFIRNLLHWQRFKNFADGSCGPYALLQRFLVLVHGMHPRDAESIFSSKKTPAIGRLVHVCREVTVRAGQTMLDDEEVFGAYTGGGARMERASDVRDLDSRGAWEQDILKDNGYFDTRAMVLLAKCLGMESRIVTERGSLTDIDGLTDPLERAGCVLHEGNHFEFMVYQVSSVFI